MPSPFSGMNPYLEQPDVWHDFHQAYTLAIRNALTPQIRPGYIAKVDDHIYIHELSGEERGFLNRSDVSVVRPGDAAEMATDRRAVTAPAVGRITPGVDILREPFIEIRDRETREVITVVELLSPTNKTPGSDREQYIGKRKAILASNAHLVEIDLLRGGQRMPIDDTPSCDYLVMVSRSYERPQVELWPIALRDPLPLIPIPLRRADRDATIELGMLLNEQFDAAGYEHYIYQGAPQPPLVESDRAWVEQVLASNQPRTAADS